MCYEATDVANTSQLVCIRWVDGILKAKVKRRINWAEGYTTHRCRFHVFSAKRCFTENAHESSKNNIPFNATTVAPKCMALNKALQCKSKKK